MPHRFRGGHVLTLQVDCRQSCKTCQTTCLRKHNPWGVLWHHRCLDRHTWDTANLNPYTQYLPEAPAPPAPVVAGCSHCVPYNGTHNIGCPGAPA